MITSATLYTPEDLLNLPENVQFELVGGQLVERNMSQESSWIAGELHRRLANHCEATGLGWAFPADAGYQCFPDDPGKVRKPDVSFVRNEVIARFGMPAGYARFAPDLAVEVVSPHDIIEALSEKIDDYFSAGVRLVWVIDPLARKAFIHRPQGRGLILPEADELDGEDVVPGFRCPIGELFRRLDALSPSEG